LSTGGGDYRKGPDMLLKTAKILKELKFDFEWLVAGGMPDDLRKFVEKKCRCSFESCNVRFIGFVDSDRLSDLLCSSMVYVHTAYMENSPNSICEAQLLGVPVVSTNVGGISSLVRDGIDGLLVPSNDPWTMAHSIVRLINDKPLMKTMSENSSSFARKRHDDNNIKEQLLTAYREIVQH
jgi:glycosyltransferase involved in cell wall biosynthesis